MVAVIIGLSLCTAGSWWPVLVCILVRLRRAGAVQVLHACTVYIHAYLRAHTHSLSLSLCFFFFYPLSLHAYIEDLVEKYPEIPAALECHKKI